MQEYQSSKLLKSIQTNQKNDQLLNKITINEDYQPPDQFPKEFVDVDLLHQHLGTLIQPFEKEVEKKKEIKKKMNTYTQPQTTEKQQIEVENLPEIPLPAPHEEFDNMKPFILGDNDTNKEISRDNISFIEALKQGDCILQLPNKLPFHDIGKNEQDKKGEQQSELIKYYEECYDSNGFQLTQQYKKLSNSKQVGISLGKIVIRENGQAVWKAGREEFEINRGISQNIDKKIIMIDNEDNKYKFIDLNEKWIVQPQY